MGGLVGVSFKSKFPYFVDCFLEASLVFYPLDGVRIWFTVKGPLVLTGKTGDKHFIRGVKQSDIRMSRLKE